MLDGKASSAAEQVTPSGSLTDLAEDYRRTRAEVESSILPLATSVDGRQFTFSGVTARIDAADGRVRRPRGR
jgi:hypothetical protein